MINIVSNFGQIFHNHILYYRVEIEGGYYFISSERKKLELKDLEGRGIRFPALQNHEAHPYSCLQNNPWSSESIKKFLDSKESNHKPIDPKDLFLRVKNIIQKCPHPEDETELSLLTLFPFQSGLCSVFKTTPYHSVVGDSYLKQLLLELMEKISFNGIRLNSPHGSLISRIISLGSTPIITIDGDHLGNYSFNNLLGVLEEGCRSSGSFYVLNELGLPISLPIYSAKMLDVGIGAKYLKNPYIEIQVEKQPDSPFYLHMTKTEQELQDLRDDLHICCLENVNPIWNIYQNPVTIPGISNQCMEFLSGTFSIAKHLDTFFEVPFLFDSMVTWAKEMALRFKHNQKFDDKDSAIVYLVAEFIQRFEPDTDEYYVAGDIARYINEAGDLSDKLRPEDVTRRLKRFHPHRKRDKVVINDEGDKRRRIKIKFDYGKLLKQVNA